MTTTTQSQESTSSFEVSNVGTGYAWFVVIRPDLQVPINGLAVQGRGNIFAAHGGGDLGVGAGWWNVSPGNAQEVADIEAYETENDPDKFANEDVSLVALFTPPTDANGEFLGFPFGGPWMRTATGSRFPPHPRSVPTTTSTLAS